MNIKEYISTGVLEAYVAGLLPENERRDLEEKLLDHPELRSELEKIEIVHEEILNRISVAPRPHLKESILNRISDGKVIAMDTAVSYWKMAAAASLAFAVIAGVAAYNYYNKWQASQSDLVALQEQNKRIAEDYNEVNRNIDAIKQDLNVLSDPRFERVVMNGTTNSPEALATVFWNESTSEVFLRIQNMKDLAEENQYQLWAIIDGKPVDAGVFDVASDRLIKMKDIGKGAVKFAVTIEPRGGKVSPTLDTMQVIGDVKKG